jgi:hypothetical protein
VTGYVQVYCNFATNGGYWHASPGHFYLADATGGNLNFKMPSVDGLEIGDEFAAKIVGGTGTFTATFHAWGTELINGLPTQVLQQAGQGRIYRVGAPAGPAAGKGWMSQ